MSGGGFERKSVFPQQLANEYAAAVETLDRPSHAIIIIFFLSLQLHLHGGEMLKTRSITFWFFFVSVFVLFPT